MSGVWASYVHCGPVKPVQIMVRMMSSRLSTVSDHPIFHDSPLPALELETSRQLAFLPQKDFNPGVNPFPPPLTLLLFSKNKFVYGTVASCPRAVIDRLLGCVGTVRIDTNYTKRLLDPHLDIVRAP